MSRLAKGMLPATILSDLLAAMASLGINPEGKFDSLLGPGDPHLKRRSSVDVITELQTSIETDKVARNRADSEVAQAAEAAQAAKIASEALERCRASSGLQPMETLELEPGLQTPDSKDALDAKMKKMMSPEQQEELKSLEDKVVETATKARIEAEEAEVAASAKKRAQGKNPTWVCELWPLSSRWHKREGLIVGEAPNTPYESIIKEKEMIYGTPDQLYIHLLREGSGLMRECAFRWHLGAVKAGKWVPGTVAGSYMREVSFVLKLQRPVPLLPDTPQVICNEALYFDKSSQTLVFQTAVQVPNMPQGEKFTTNAQLRFVRAEDKCSEAEFSFETRFNQRTMLRPMISAAASTVVGTQTDVIFTFLKAFLRHHGCRPPASYLSGTSYG